MVMVSGDQSLRQKVLQTKAVQGWGGAFLVCQRPDKAGRALVSPTGSRKAFFPGACPVCVLELLGVS